MSSGSLKISSSTGGTRRITTYFHWLEVWANKTILTPRWEGMLHFVAKCPFKGHCIVCPCSIYGFWLPLWYRQYLLPHVRLFSTTYIVTSWTLLVCFCLFVCFVLFCFVFFFIFFFHLISSCASNQN
jgi:Sec-independent protein secretion pathway component TatC